MLALVDEDDEEENDAAKLPDGWEFQIGEKGETWYFNTLTRDISWEKPRESAYA